MQAFISWNAFIKCMAGPNSCHCHNLHKNVHTFKKQPRSFEGQGESFNPHCSFVLLCRACIYVCRSSSVHEHQHRNLPGGSQVTASQPLTPVLTQRTSLSCHSASESLNIITGSSGLSLTEEDLTDNTVLSQSIVSGFPHHSMEYPAEAGRKCQQAFCFCFCFPLSSLWEDNMITPLILASEDAIIEISVKSSIMDP